MNPFNQEYCADGFISSRQPLWAPDFCCVCQQAVIHPPPIDPQSHLPEGLPSRGKEKGSSLSHPHHFNGRSVNPVSKTPLNSPWSGKENTKQFLENEGKLWLFSVDDPGPILGGEGKVDVVRSRIRAQSLPALQGTVQNDAGPAHRSVVLY